MKISYADYIKKTNVSILVAEAIFNEIATNSKLVKISEIAHTTSGGTPLRSNSEYYGGLIPWLKSGELNDNYISDAEEYISEIGLKNSSAKLHPKGTLLIAMYGATVGKTGITLIEACTNQAICAVFPKKEISRDYLFWFFKSYRYKFIEQSKGGAQPNISQTVINNTFIPVQDENAQNEIVLFLDKIDITGKIEEEDIPERFKGAIMSVLNVKNSFTNITSELTYQLTLVKQLRQSFLREAMQGKLTADFRSAHPELTEGENSAQALLEKIKAEKKQLIKDGKLKKEKELSPVSEDEIPFDIPKSWVWCRLGEICTELLGGYAFDSTRYSKIETQNQVLRLGNVKPNQLVLETSPVFIDDDYAKEAIRAKLFNGDILITMTGTRAKKDYLFSLCLNESDLETKTLFLNQRVGCFRFGAFVSNNYINITIKDIRLLQAVFDSSTGAANQANIGITALKDILIPLPPLTEQQVIVSKLDELMRTCDELEASIRNSQQQNEMLLREVLREALEG